MIPRPRPRPARRPLAAFTTAALLVLTPAVAAAQSPSPAEAAVAASLDASLRAFNAGDFAGFLRDFASRVRYNEFTVPRARLVEINRDLKGTFPDLKMRYDSRRVTAPAPGEVVATTVSTFTGSTPDYEGSGLAARYRESGQVTARYRPVGAGQWRTDTLQVAWNDAFIDIGPAFAMLGFEALPALQPAGRPYRLRLQVGSADSRPGAGVAYAYMLAPLADLLSKADAEKAYERLQFKPLPPAGLDSRMPTPTPAGTYAHVLVVNKFVSVGPGQPVVPLGQKIYTRVLRVE